MIRFRSADKRPSGSSQSRGLVTISGVDMFVNQAVLQFELWTGHQVLWLLTDYQQQLWTGHQRLL